MKRDQMTIAVKTVLAVFVLGILVGCDAGPNSGHPFQKYVEGVVEKVEYTQSGNGFLNPGHQTNHIYFIDGRSVSIIGRLPAGKAFVIGQLNRIWFDGNSAGWIRDVEILSSGR